MHSAQDKITGKMCEAAHLYLRLPVDTSRYICPGCRVAVVPASYMPDNLVRPYFKTTKTHPHLDGCDVDGEKKLVARARKGRVSSPISGFPGSYPCRLQLDDVREAVGERVPLQSGQIAKSSEESQAGRGLVRQRRWTAKAIRPLACTFMNYPYDRDLPLAVEGIHGKTFRDVFGRVTNNRIILHERPKLFYAPISWWTPVERQDAFEVKLGYGEWVGEKLEQPYRVRVMWADWSDSRKRHIRHEIEVARQEAIAAGKKNSRVKGWLFFKGLQAANDILSFVVSDYRLICCIADEMIWTP